MTENAALTDISGDYTLDVAHSRLGFVARHAVVTKVRGQFSDWSATAHIDTANPAASSVTLTINRPASAPAAPTATVTCSPPRLLRRGAVPPSGSSSPPRSAATATSGPSPAT